MESAKASAPSAPAEKPKYYLCSSFVIDLTLRVAFIAAAVYDMLRRVPWGPVFGIGFGFGFGAAQFMAVFEYVRVHLLRHCDAMPEAVTGCLAASPMLVAVVDIIIGAWGMADKDVSFATFVTWAVVLLLAVFTGWCILMDRRC